MIKGLDCSHYQKVKSWKEVFKDGFEFVFFKARQGDAYRDPTFIQNASGAREAGLDVKAYLFYDPTSDWLDQIDNFIQDLKNQNILEVALDFESLGDKWNLNSEEYHLQMIRAAISKLFQAGMIVNIYVTNSFIMKYLPNADCFDKCELWIAHYSETIGPIPPMWKKATYWQCSESGTAVGIDGPIDIDYFLVG